MTSERKWKFLEIDEKGHAIECIMTDSQIIKEYFPFWSKQMIKVGKKDQINEASCIEDFIVVNWAWEAENE